VARAETTFQKLSETAKKEKEVLTLDVEEAALQKVKEE